jgi:hypothetical protein
MSLIDTLRGAWCEPAESSSWSIAVMRKSRDLAAGPAEALIELTNQHQSHLNQSLRIVPGTVG